MNTVPSAPIAATSGSSALAQHNTIVQQRMTLGADARIPPFKFISFKPHSRVMASNPANDWRYEYGLVLAKTFYSNYVITIFTAGIQCFMAFYTVITYFESSQERRQGRGGYILVGCLIFLVYTLGACVDVTQPFDMLLQASNGLDYLRIRGTSRDWREFFSFTCLTILFILGDGLLVQFSFEYQPVPVLSNPSWSLDVASRLTDTYLFVYDWHLAKSLPAKRLSVYTTAVRVLVESALPLAIAGIIQIAVTLSSRSMVNFSGDRNAMMATIGATSLLYYALLIIIFRITMGRSLAATSKSADAGAFSRSLAFNHGPQGEDSLMSNDVEVAQARPRSEADSTTEKLPTTMT
ncbi:hypothetical protein FA15DRAFT_658143 [Coprinopsis marcescibilis]|uniref:Uncharacterized protein n=1 Tax=Coprinopsis marcescibilis TaxID=230819 RepID=A0A5C3L093_COPMA|nr:hypothetical protein FA15DRAFT_658143 [Coprinopsis marcescibilis]